MKVLTGVALLCHYLRMIFVLPCECYILVLDRLLAIFYFCRRVCDEDNNEFSVDSTITEDDIDNMVGVEVKCHVLNNTIQEMLPNEDAIDTEDDVDIVESSE